VPIAAILTLLPMLLGLAGFDQPNPSPRAGQQTQLRVRSVVVEDQLIIRVPVRPQSAPIEWVEHKGPKCIASSAIRGAFLSGNDHVDFLIEGRRLLRAELDENCPALDFYEGFYLSPQDDRICAERDVIRSRIGSTCGIQQFKKLVPKAR
jgi:hypothetical protein